MTLRFEDVWNNINLHGSYVVTGFFPDPDSSVAPGALLCSDLFQPSHHTPKYRQVTRYQGLGAGLGVWVEDH